MAVSAATERRPRNTIALAATLICRIATLWFAVFIGIIVAGVLAARGITPVPGEEVKV